MEKFASKAKRFTLQLIAQREQIIRRNRCRRNKLEMANTASNLKRLLQAYPYNTNHAMAQFIVRHKAEIVAIAPGEGAANHDAAMNTLQTILNEALCHTTSYSTAKEFPL